MPEVAGSTVSKFEEKYVPGEKVPVRTDEGWGEVLFHGPHPPSETGPFSPGEQGSFFG